MRTRVPSVGGLLRVVGLAGTLVGCLLTVASLSKTWAVDGPREGVAAPETGWQHIAYGDVLLCAACVLVAILATALCVGPPSRRVTRTAGGAALTLLVGALAAVAITYWMAGLDFSFFDSSDELRRFDAGPGYQDAATGLAVASLGMLVLLAGRWEARTRKALRREAAAAAAAATAPPADRDPGPTALA